MKLIWKYPLLIENDVTVQMPVGAELLTVQVQHGAPCLWALVDPAAPLEDRHLRVAGTGHTLAEHAGRYVGSFQMYDGAFVGHVFDENERGGV